MRDHDKSFEKEGSKKYWPSKRKTDIAKRKVESPLDGYRWKCKSAFTHEVWSLFLQEGSVLVFVLGRLLKGVQLIQNAKRRVQWSKIEDNPSPGRRRRKRSRKSTTYKSKRRTNCLVLFVSCLKTIPFYQQPTRFWNYSQYRRPPLMIIS